MRPGGAAAISVLLVALAAAGCGSTPAHTRTTGGSSCNGSAALCARGLGEVIFPGTHNSFSASEQPGWRLANQRYGISRQLQDGIRALLIDVHYGIRDPATGRVRTDLAAEGSDRNKAAQQLSPAALLLADRLAGGVGLGTLQGTPELYLCHTLCELGAEPLAQELEAIGRFLAEHPGTVLVVIVEDYAPASAIAEAFRGAGLERYAATLERNAPLPTLGTLIAAGHPLLVFSEKQGGSPAWYMPAFRFIADTPLGAVRPSQLGCARYRGEADSPLLLINHWIPPFPPSPALNTAIGKAPFLRARTTRCLAERGAKGAIVAVDFYERTSVVRVAEELNARG